MTETPELIPINVLSPHPGNPRLTERTDIIEQLAALIRQHGFDAAHAIMARPLGNGYQILSGHNRVKAAESAQVWLVPTWVREMDDDAAYMQLVLANTQGELSMVERGQHALNSGRTIAAYAESVARHRRTVENDVCAAKVALATRAGGAIPDVEPTKLVEIEATQPWLWPALVETAKDMKRAQLRELIRDKLKGAPDSKWAFSWDRIARRVVDGDMGLDEVQEMLDLFQHYVVLWREQPEIQEALYSETSTWAEARSPELLEAYVEGEMDKVLKGHNVATKAQLEQVLRPLLADLEDPGSAQEKAVSLFAIVSLERWKELDDATKRILLDPSKLPATGTFNQQHGDGIDWAKWSWNPITGCLHDCPYCYARDIATLGNTARAFPHGFAPALKPVHLNTPRNMSVPRGAAKDQRLRNVFCGSMSDWWGRWVPREWIEAVLEAIRAAAGWNFLVLTKFPRRAAEFGIPRNTWMGTTVDLQARVRNAEAAFADIDAAVRWLSIEPMLENLRFSRLDLFQWIVVGGASQSSRTPEWKPPFTWIADLMAQAREAGVPVYMKPNLLGHRVLEMPGGLPVPQDYPAVPPSVFDYLSNKQTLEAKPLAERHHAGQSA